jgi:hypothetical protein
MTPIENHIHAAKEYLYLAKTWNNYNPTAKCVCKKVRNDNKQHYIKLAEAQILMAETYVDTKTNIFYNWI